MLRLIWIILAVWLLALPVQARPATVFYQPQNRDARLADSDWQTLFRTVRQAGFDTLLVQWTRWGEEDFGGRDGWLARAVEQARDAGLAINLGLYADPQFFRWIQQDGTELDIELARYARETLATARAWSASGTVQAWYLPAELDDLHWQQAGKRARLMATLSAIRSGLPATLHPAGISAFFTGQSSPAQLQRWYGELQQQGWQVWVQDGAGTRALPAAQRKSYLDALFACPQRAGTPALVLEAFRQTSTADAPFAAIPASPAQWQAQTRETRSLCPSATGVFSLRYLPQASGYLQP